MKVNWKENIHRYADSFYSADVCGAILARVNFDRTTRLWVAAPCSPLTFSYAVTSKSLGEVQKEVESIITSWMEEKYE